MAKNIATHDDDELAIEKPETLNVSAPVAAFGKINFSAAGGNLLPAGDYKAKCDQIEQRNGKDSGQPYWNMRFVVDTDDENDGTFVWCIVSLSPGALWRLKKLLKVYGIEPDENGDWQPEYSLDDDGNPLEVKGAMRVLNAEFFQPVLIKVNHEKNEKSGEMVAKVSEIKERIQETAAGW